MVGAVELKNMSFSTTQGRLNPTWSTPVFDSVELLHAKKNIHLVNIREIYVIQATIFRLHQSHSITKFSKWKARADLDVKIDVWREF